MDVAILSALDAEHLGSRSARVIGRQSGIDP
jgi:hypothetical protein